MIMVSTAMGSWKMGKMSWKRIPWLFRVVREHVSGIGERRGSFTYGFGKVGNDF